MLERLDLVEGQLTALQSWPPEAHHSALRWLHDYPQLRNAADQLGAANEDAVIYLPVVVRE